MSKTKHDHVIIATITCAMPFDPADLDSAVIVQKQFKSMASTLVGFRSVETRMGKLPAKVAVAAAPAADPAMPAFLKR